MDNLFRNTQRAQQLINFDTLRLGGGMMPTDIDGLIEYQNTCYVLIEYKHREAQLSKGQGLALNRLCTDLNKVKPTILILASHTVDDPAEQVSAGDAIVTKWRTDGEWIPDGKRTVRQVVTEFIQGNGV